MKGQTPFPRARKLNTAVLGIASLVLIVFVGLSYRQLKQYRRADAEAARSREISAAIDSVLAVLADGESGERGFLLTNEDSYLQPYDRALQKLPSHLATLGMLLSKSHRNMQDFDELNSLANHKLIEMRQTIAARRAKGPQAALAIVLTGEGKGTMDSIRALCGRMRRNEDAIQARTSAAGQGAAGVALLITVAGALVLFFFFAFGLQPFASPDPMAWQRPAYLRYGAAVLGVAAMTLARAALTPVMDPISMPFTLYFAAIAFAAWFGGFRPALLSIVLSLMAGAWFFAAPRHSFYVVGHDDQTAMLMLVLVGFGIALLSRSQHNAVERALRAENAERSERQRLGLALSAGKMGGFEGTADGEMSWWSLEAYALFGVNPADFEVTRDSFAALIHPRDRELFLQYWDENIAARQPINHEFRIVRPDGKERWINCQGIPRYHDSGAAAEYSGIFVDVTERREAEKVLRQFERLSTAARLSAAIAHGINNPLNAVANLIYLAKEAPGVPPSIVEQLALAEQEIERAAVAARQALGFYRDPSRAGPIEVEQLIESVLNVFSAKIAEKNIRIVRGFQNSGPVYGVRGELRQVVSNLLANAIEAVGEGGAISVATRPARAGAERAIEIVIADDGPGIAVEHLDHIFEPFFTTKAGTGTGLGLWVAKEIVERHEGSIEVQPPDSASGNHGAAFLVRLPGGAGAREPSPRLDPMQAV